MLLGYPRPFPCGHRCTVGIDRDPPMRLDAQGGIKAKRQPYCGWCCLEAMCLVRGRRDVLSCTFCQLLELRIFAPLLDWSSCSQAISRHHSYHPGFEVHVSLRATAFSTSPNIFVWRSAVLCFSRFVLCLSFVQVLCNVASVVLELLRLDGICVPLLSCLVHVLRDLALPHEVLQHGLVFVETCP